MNVNLDLEAGVQQPEENNQDESGSDEQDESFDAGDAPTVREALWNFTYGMEDRNLTQNIKCLFNSPQLADVIFLLYDENRTGRILKPVFAHSFVLLACSPYFRAVLHFNTKPCRFLITSIKFKHFLNIMRLIYVGWNEQIIPLNEVAEYYRVIKELCLLDMFEWQIRTWLMKCICHDHVNNIAMIYVTSLENQFRDLTRECLGEMADYPSKILDDPNFTRIPLRGMITWIKRPLTNATKKDLEKAVQKWMDANTQNTDENGKAELLHLVRTTEYRHKGKRFQLQIEPGAALSYKCCDDELTQNWDQTIGLPMVVDDHNYHFTASFDIMFDETIKVYGLSMVFVKHKNHDDRFSKCQFYGEVELFFNNNQIMWDSFNQCINFQEESFVTVECFFIRTLLDHNENYTVEVNWQAIGAYPDILTFETTQSYVKTFGDCFVSALWFDPYFNN